MLKFRRLATLAALFVAFPLARAADAHPEHQTEYLFVELSGVTDAEAPAVARSVGAIGGVVSFTWTTPLKEAKVVREVGTAGDGWILRAAKDSGADTAILVPLGVTTLTFETSLHCDGCVKTVTTALRAVAGVKDVVVPAGLATVWIAYDSRTVKVAALRTVLANAGNPVKP